MFRRTPVNLPKDPDYPADLAGLGFKLNEHGQFVKIDNSKEHFTFFETDNERANEVHKERMHECVRKIVLSSLATMDVKPIHINGDTFVYATPEGPHVTILATEPLALKDKRDVIVIVNEHMQDLGIWAYRTLMREGGLDGGSAVGMMKKLQSWRSGKVARDSVAGIDTVERAVQKLKLDDSGAEAIDARKEHDTPGLIILNPGQLHYSHQLNKSMSQPEWLGRPKETAISDAIRIDPVHNRVPGHENPDAHVANVFEHVIRRITRKDVRLYVVGLSEGGEALLKYLDNKFLADTQDPIGDKIEGIALMQPAHNPSALGSEAFATFLAGPRCRSYVLPVSDEPKGTLLAVPNPYGQPKRHYDDDMMASGHSNAEHYMAASGHGAGGHHRAGSESSTSQAIDIPPSPTRFRNQAIAGSVNSLFSGNPRSLEAKSSSYSFPKSAAAMQQSVASLQTNGSLDKSQSTLSKSYLNQDDDDEEPNPYADVQVSCATFSCGPLQDNVTEMIWPAVMDVVLEWFESIAELVEEQGCEAARRAEREEQEREEIRMELETGGSGFA